MFVAAAIITAISFAATKCGSLPASYLDCDRYPSRAWPSMCCDGRHAESLESMCKHPITAPIGVCQNITRRPLLAWVVESERYAEAVRLNTTTNWRIEWCGANGKRCSIHSPAAATVRAVVGRADALNLSALPALGLVQSASWYPVDGSAVPARVVIANFDIWPTPWYHPYSVSNLGEFLVAAVFDDTYRLAARAKDMLSCAFAADAPIRCPAASAATNHTTVGDLTIGVLGYGRIGAQAAQRLAALGSTVVATRRHGPFEPAPPGLKWLSDDNDRLLRTVDVVVVTCSAPGLINATCRPAGSNPSPPT